MKIQITVYQLWGTFASALLLMAMAIAPADAAPINYGDFSGTSVMYLDVTETANSPGDTEPLFGDGVPGAPLNPKVVGNTLDFNPAGFVASSTGGTPDLTDGQLNFALMAVPGASIELISFQEGGDRSLLGTGSTTTQVAYALNLGAVVVTEVDGVALGTPKALSLASVLGGDDLSGGPISGGWNLSLAYDVDAALTAAGVSFVSGATKLEIALNNTMFAASEQSSSAFVAKKDFRIDVDTDPFVPEPTSLAMTLLGLVAYGISGRRTA